VNLPHACTHGTCGTCKVEVLDGDVDLGDASAFALLESERAEGKALICTARPRSDVQIEADVAAEEGIVFHPVRDFVGTVAEIDDCARDIRRVLIELDQEICFNAGQYVRVRIPGQAELTRSWSMANPPEQNRRIELQIRRVFGGLATDGWVFDGLTAGDQVSLSGPYGRFFIRPARPEPVILVGGGTGVCPLKSMVRHVLEGGGSFDAPLTLYHGARTRADIHDVDFFRGLQERFAGQFHYRPALSDEPADGFAYGLITDVLSSDFDTCAGHVGYLCGPPPMVEATLKTLMAKRLFPRDIYREDFFDTSDKATGGIRSPLIRVS
jgi:phenol hydroxylase P5 protein